MTTNQTIDGVRKLAEQACGTSPDSPAYRRFIAAMNPTLLLDLTAPAAQANGEPVADDHIPVEGMFRIEDTEKERIVWIKGGGFKCSSYDFCHFGKNLNFVGLKWEWNGDLKLVMGWNCAPELRVKPEPIRPSQFSLLGGFPDVGGEPVLGPNGWQVASCHTEQATGSASICGDNRELNPASQPQVEPFGYWLAPKGQPLLGMFHRVTVDDKIVDSQSVIDSFDVTALYAKKPAPVAVK